MSLALFSLSFHFGAFATVGCRRNLRPCVRAELGAKLWPGTHGKVRWNGASSWKSRLLQVVLFSVSCPFLCYLSIFRAKVLFLHVQTTQGAIGNLSPTGEWYNDALYRVHDCMFVIQQTCLCQIYLASQGTRQWSRLLTLLETCCQNEWLIERRNHWMHGQIEWMK
jgi:hypothetical protein